MRYLIAIIVFLVMLGISFLAVADNYHHNNYTPPEPTTTTHVTEVTELTNITDVVNTYNNYNVDECGSTAIAQAGANNQMHIGSDKPQLSIGGGTCGEMWATNLMFGMKINKSMFVNGSWGHDFNTDVESGGVGLLVIFK